MQSSSPSRTRHPHTNSVQHNPQHAQQVRRTAVADYNAYNEARAQNATNIGPPYTWPPPIPPALPTPSPRPQSSTPPLPSRALSVPSPRTPSTEVSTPQTSVPSTRRSTPAFGEEPTPSKKHHGHQFTFRENYHMVRLAAEVNPWNAPWAAKGKRWAQILQKLNDLGCCDGVSQTSLQHRINGLLDGFDGSGRLVASIRAQLESEDGNRLAALLDRASEHRKRYETQRKGKRKAAQQREDEDENAGAALREAALHTQGKHTATNATSGDKSDTTSDVPRPPARKRRKTIEEESCDIMRQHLEHTQAAADRDARFQAAILSELRAGNDIQREFNRLFSESQDALRELLRQILAPDGV